MLLRVCRMCKCSFLLKNTHQLHIKIISWVSTQFSTYPVSDYGESVFSKLVQILKFSRYNGDPVENLDWRETRKGLDEMPRTASTDSLLHKEAADILQMLFDCKSHKFWSWQSTWFLKSSAQTEFNLSMSGVTEKLKVGKLSSAGWQYVLID